MGNTSSQRSDLRSAVELSVSVATFVSAAYFFYSVTDMLSHHTGQENSFTNEKKELARKLKRPELECLEFSRHEISVAIDVICADDLKTSFHQVGGMEKEIELIMDNVILPFKFWKEENDARERKKLLLENDDAADSLECHVPGGMLLYGRPGTGKSMLAKAIAKEAEASFIGVKSGTILDKFVGESDKLVGAIFSLAQKIAPTVIFIDEIDTLLKKRDTMSSGSSSGTSSMLGTLMSEWDGLNTDGNAPVIVLGATNRPMDIDAAFLRRMPLTIQTVAPDYASRIDILKKMLQNEKLSDDVNIELIAASIDGYTGSDIREVCRLASISRMKSILKAKKDNTEIDSEESRLLKQADFDRAITKSLEDGQRQAEYSDELSFDETREKMENVRNWMKAAIAQSKNQNNSV